jgi:hypothetical protein
MWFLVIPNALAKNMIPLIRQKSFLEENKERGNEPARDVTTEGGSRGASPPAFTRTTITSKSPSEAVFIKVPSRMIQS